MIIDFHIFSTPMTLTLLTILILERLLKNINKSYVMFYFIVWVSHVMKYWDVLIEQSLKSDVN